MSNEPQKKTFSLKAVETQLLITTSQAHNSVISNITSFIAMERLAYPVTTNTRFKFSDDLKSLEIWEEPEVAEVVTDTSKPEAKE